MGFGTNKGRIRSSELTQGRLEMGINLDNGPIFMNKNGTSTDLEDLLNFIHEKADEGMDNTEIAHSIPSSLTITPVVDLIGLVRLLDFVTKSAIGSFVKNKYRFKEEQKLADSNDSES